MLNAVQLYKLSVCFELLKIYLNMIEEGEIEGEEQIQQQAPLAENVPDDKKITKKRDIVAMMMSNPVRRKYLRESLKFFTLIRKNIYSDRKRKQPKNDEMEPCFCCPKKEDLSMEHTNVSYNCGERCLNRMMSTQCDDETCRCGDLCLNRKFQKHDYAYVYPMPEGGKGWGLCAGEKIVRGQFIMQYIGQIFSTNSDKGRSRVKEYSKSTCTYLMKTSKGEVIDPTYKGNHARFINHSCEPNCITQKWNVLGQICIGIFALKDIEEDEELTFDYQFDVYSTPLTKCLCGTKKCKGYLGLKPTDITAEEWNERLEDMTCEICEKNYDDDDLKLIICDECNRGFHIFCLTPPLDSIPDGSFFCKGCEEKKQLLKLQKEKEQRERLKQTKILVLEDEHRRKQDESSDDDNEPIDQEYERMYKFFKKQEIAATKQLIYEKEQMVPEEPERKTPQKKKTPSAITGSKRPASTPLSKKKDEFYQVTNKAIDKFQVYLQKNQNLYQRIITFNNKKDSETQNDKKNLQMNKIQMQLILKSNFILFEKIGAQIYFDINHRNSIDFFLKNIEVSVIGNEQQIKMFEEIVEITNNIINELQIEMGITEAYISIPAIFIKKIIGPGYSIVNAIEKQNQITVYYHRSYINEECYPLEVTCKLLLKGGKQNILKAYEDIKKRLSVLELERLYFNPYEIKTVVNNMNSLKRKVGIAEFRISRESPFKEINHPFYYVQQKNKEIAIIGTRTEVEKTRKQIMSFFEEPNRKEEFNFNISLYLAQPNQKSVLLSVKNMLEKEIPSIKMMIFDPTPPRKNMTLSFLGTRQNRQRAKEYLFKKLESMFREGRLVGNLEMFQDQMHYQMTKYYFKYMQNSLLTKDTAFMKSWDILNQHYCDSNLNYMWKSVRKQLVNDYQTLLYACYVLKDKLILKIQEETHSNLTVMQEVFEIIRQNVNKILNIFNVNNTSSLKNYTSSIDYEEAKKIFKETYSHISYLRPEKVDLQKTNSIVIDITPEGLENRIKERELSFFQRKTFKKYKNLFLMLEEDRIRSRDKDQERKKDKWK